MTLDGENERCAGEGIKTSKIEIRFPFEYMNVINTFEYKCLR